MSDPGDHETRQNSSDGNRGHGKGDGTSPVRRRKVQRSNKNAKARKPSQFEIEVVTPPPQSLGIHELCPTTHNGEQISIEGTEYIVTSLILQYKLKKGRYVRDHNKLQVQSTGRFLYNEYLSSLMEGSKAEDTGSQD